MSQIVVIDKNGNIINSKRQKNKSFQLGHKKTPKNGKRKSSKNSKHKSRKLMIESDKEFEDKKSAKVRNKALKIKFKEQSILSESDMHSNLDSITDNATTDINDDDKDRNNRIENDARAHFDELSNMEWSVDFDETENDDICGAKNDSTYINNASNSIKAGFRNLIAIIEPNKSSDIKYSKAKPNENHVSEYSTSESDATDAENVEMANNEVEQERIERFYSLKGYQSDAACALTADDEDELGTFNAIKTKSLQTLLNLSQKLHIMSLPMAPKVAYKSEIEYDDQATSGYDDDIGVGLKSGLYKP